VVRSSPVRHIAEIRTSSVQLTQRIRLLRRTALLAPPKELLSILVPHRRQARRDPAPRRRRHAELGEEVAHLLHGAIGDGEIGVLVDRADCLGLDDRAGRLEDFLSLDSATLQ
jgi:hypothetical protein